jgi:hypothetical protein
MYSLGAHKDRKNGRKRKREQSCPGNNLEGDCEVFVLQIKENGVCVCVCGRRVGRGVGHGKVPY